MAFVHVYTGDGKGKTTASLGLILRSLGWGNKVCMIQFIKGYREIGELKFAENCENFEFIQVSNTDRLSISEKDVLDRKTDAETALEIAKEKVFSGEYDLVVLDEINGAVFYNLVNESDVLNLIEHRNEKTELILTGSPVSSKILESADYATEMKKIKHPYDKGVPARRMIDF